MVGIPNAASRRRCFFEARAPRKENGSEKIAAPLWWSRRRRFFRMGTGSVLCGYSEGGSSGL
nr:hypothetical protein [Bacillaceae bacterium]